MAEALGPIVARGNFEIEAANLPKSVSVRTSDSRSEYREISVRLQIGSQRHHGADIQIAIRPSVEPMTNTLSEGIVHRRMTKGALNSYAPQSSLLIEELSQSHNRIQFEKCKSCWGLLRSTFSLNYNDDRYATRQELTLGAGTRLR